MNVLWISSSAIGPASRILDLPYGGSSGSWIQTEYEAIKKDSNVKMYFLTPVSIVSNGTVIENTTTEGTAYGIGFNPKISFGKRLPKEISAIIETLIHKIGPDIIHIWGSESSFSATSAILCPEIPKVIYIQGLIGMHRRYMGDGYIREKEYFGRNNLFDSLKVKLKLRYYDNHIILEQQAIKSAGNIISDNNFTKAYCNSFSSPTFHNHFLYPNDIYYRSAWNYDNIERNSIFTIFSSNPSKGLSQLLKALAIVRKQIPDIKLYVPGPFTITPEGQLDSKRCKGFEKWLSNYINSNNLLNNVIFTGRLDAEGMCEQYLKCNVFVSPSCMEVHSSSVREAMAVGAPTISSLCGSVIEYIQHGKNGLIYRFEEEEVLASYILKIIEDKEFAMTIGQNARLKMAKNNLQTHLSEIYKTILSGKN